jgi:hypothetical protein
LPGEDKTAGQKSRECAPQAGRRRGPSSLSQGNCQDFTCPQCESRYRLVRAKTGAGTSDQPVHCLVCGHGLTARDREYGSEVLSREPIKVVTPGEAAPFPRCPARRGAGAFRRLPRLRRGRRRGGGDRGGGQGVRRRRGVAGSARRPAETVTAADRRTRQRPSRCFRGGDRLQPAHILLCWAKELTLRGTVYGPEHVIIGRRGAGHNQFGTIPSATGGIARLAYARAQEVHARIPSMVRKSATRDAIQRKAYTQKTAFRDNAKAVLNPCCSVMCRLRSTAFELSGESSSVSISAWRHSQSIASLEHP